ncbi:unnamed protein product, partial [marine sediment metagenome]
LKNIFILHYIALIRGQDERQNREYRKTEKGIPDLFIIEKKNL